MIITELLAVLSVSAAAGLRLALPLLLIGLLSGAELWSNVPILSQFPPTVVVGVLVSWSLFELILSKERRIRRFVQSVELLISPWVGGIAGVAIAKTLGMAHWLAIFLGLLGGLLALVFQLVQVGWLYRLRYPPLWVLFVQDALCICLVIFAFDAPRQGGLIALLLLWLSLRTSNLWRQWYVGQSLNKGKPRRLERSPD